MPAGTTQNPVKIADDGSAEVIDIYAGTDWDAHRGDVAPLAASSCVGSALMPVPPLRRMRRITSPCSSFASRANKAE